MLTGIGTVLIDNPELTCRLSGGRGKTPVRIIFDSDLRLRGDSAIVQTRAAGSVIVFCSQTADSDSQAELEKYDIEVVRLKQNGGGLDLSAALHWCEQRQLSSLLLEAGTELNSNFYAAGLINQIIHLTSPKILKSGVPGLLYDATAATALAFPRDTHYMKVRSGDLAGDLLSIWQRDLK